MPTPTYIPLANITLGTSDALIEFTSLPTRYKHFEIVVDCLGSSATNAFLRMRLNNGTTENSGYIMYSNIGTSIITGVTYTGNNELNLTNFAPFNSSTRLASRIKIMFSKTPAGNQGTINIAESGNASTTELFIGRGEGKVVTSVQLFPSVNSFGALSTFAIYGIDG